MEKQETEEKYKVFKKVFIVLVSFVLITLILSYVFIGSDIKYVLFGLIESSKIEQNVIIKVQDKELVIINDTYNKIQDVYNKNINLEFKACLLGRVIDNKYFLMGMYQPTTYKQTYDSVVAEPCNETTLISLHSHPFKRCIPSQEDINNYKQQKLTNKDLILAVMCDKERINFYTK